MIYLCASIKGTITWTAGKSLRYALFSSAHLVNYPRKEADKN